MNMKKKMVLLFLSVFLLSGTRFIFPEVVVITNPDIGLTSMKQKDIRDIFTGRKKRWDNNGKMEYYKDRNDKEGTGFDPPYSAYQKDACACLRFDLNAHWTFKLEGHLVDGVALCLNQDNLNAAGAVEYDKKWALFAVKMTFNF